MRPDLYQDLWFPCHLLFYLFINESTSNVRSTVRSVYLCNIFLSIIVHDIFYFTLSLTTPSPSKYSRLTPFGETPPVSSRLWFAYRLPRSVPLWTLSKYILALSHVTYLPFFHLYCPAPGRSRDVGHHIVPVSLPDYPRQVHCSFISIVRRLLNFYFG